MRIGFDISQTGTGKAGCGTMADSLLRHLVAACTNDHFTVYPTFGDAYWDPAGPAAIAVPDAKHVTRGPTHDSLASARSFWASPPADLEQRLGDPDVVHANNFFCPPGLRRARLVYTLYDLSFLAHPDWTTELNRQVCFRGVFQASLEADLIVAISAFSRAHFLRTFPHYPEDRTCVVPLASRFTTTSDDRPAAVDARPELAALADGGFFLFVGTLEPRKNPARLVRAYARYAARCHGTPRPLVLAGGDGWLTDRLDLDLETEGDTIRRLGYVDDEVLAWLYRRCHAFVYPSRFEGFGLPVLEAMSLGAPVITSRTSSLPEVVGEAGLLIEPTDEEALAAAMTTLDTDAALHRRLRRQARARADSFSWARSAAAVRAGYDAVVGREKYRVLP